MGSNPIPSALRRVGGSDEDAWLEVSRIGYARTMHQPPSSPRQPGSPDLLASGSAPVQARPDFWPLFGAGVVSGLLALLVWSIMFAAVVVVLLSDQISNLRDITSGDVWEAAAEFFVALAIAGFASIFVIAALLKVFTRLFTQHRVSYGHALVTGLAALVAAAAGGVFDALLVGLTFGIFALVSFAAAAAWLLQRFARPSPHGGMPGS